MANHPFDWSTWSDLDATELAQSINNGHVSVPEVMTQLADAVSLQNPTLNAVIELFDDVIETPSTSGANPDGPFYGVPILIKDMGSRIAGRDQQIGLGFKKPEPAVDDDPLIENFRQAGFIVCGRTAVPEDGMTLITHSIRQGDTRNPFNLEHTPGGSSGGSSAAVAGGITPICSASDGAGSIRFPASWTGLVGLKGTRGINPLPKGLNESIMAGAVEGALVRSMRDCASVTEALAIHRHLGGSFMPSHPPPTLRPQAKVETRRFRIGFCTQAWGSDVNIDSDVQSALAKMTQRLEHLGHQLIQLSPQDICDFNSLRESFTVAEWLLPISRELMYQVHEANVELTDANASIQLRNHLALADRYDVDDLFGAQLETEGLMRHWGAFWQHGPCDLLLSPVTPITCPEVTASYRMDSDLDFDSWFAALFDAACFTIPANHMGLPALSIPAGLDRNACPIGMQFMAPWQHEHDLLHLGFQIEQAHPELFNLKPQHGLHR
jgi:amidase